MKLTHINWFYKDEITDENDWYLFPTIMFTKHHYVGARLVVYYIHLIWLRWVRNIEICFEEKYQTPLHTTKEGNGKEEGK